jgi:hypothetical protein
MAYRWVSDEIPRQACGNDHGKCEACSYVLDPSPILPLRSSRFLTLFFVHSLRLRANPADKRIAGRPHRRDDLVTGIVVAVFFIATSVVSTLDQKGVLPGSPTGLLQRIAIIAGWSWIALLALRLLS